MIEFATYYHAFLMFIVFILTISKFAIVNRYEGYNVLMIRDNVRTMQLFLLFFVFFYGFRPLAGCFGDTLNYVSSYERMHNFGVFSFEGDGKSGTDWLFNTFMFFCSKVMDVHFFFFIIIFLYIVAMYLGCEKLDNAHVSTMMLFCIGGFIFYASAVNGIRNGMACSLVILALAYLCRDKLLWSVILSIIAIGCHKSTLLPVACMFFVRYVKNPKLMFFSWIGAILISLALGDLISNLISMSGVDPRIAQNFEVNSKGIGDIDGWMIETRFRWDFLLYSSMPILLGWYVIFWRKVYNNTYLMLLGTYIYANAFWVLAIRAIFSNRIANLSWFLYPIVLAYPLLNLPVFEKKHSKKTAWILLAHFGFTFVMFLLGKS